MRVIKFRGWDKYFKKIVEVRSINFQLQTTKVIPTKSINKLDFYETALDNIELMQYTGLKDRNGKEIYEGDIVSFYIDFGYGDQKVKAKVVFDNGSFKYENKVGSDFHKVACEDAREFNLDVEVVGNIYENSELLNV
jgi:uncharacterized phage protein (TIGR01671 family)